MRKAGRKLGMLLATIAVAGVTTLSCSSTVARQFRDAALSGATSYFEQQTYDLLAACWPVSDTDQ